MEFKAGLIKIEEYELQRALACGVARDRWCKERGIKPNHGASEEKSEAYHKLGATGELAFAKLQQIYWPGHIGTFKTERDVGRYEIRTRAETWQDLIIREDDVEAPYVLMIPTGRLSFWCCGGMRKREAASHPEWWKSPNDREEAWFVPQVALRYPSPIPPTATRDDVWYWLNMVKGLETNNV